MERTAGSLLRHGFRVTLRLRSGESSSSSADGAGAASLGGAASITPSHRAADAGLASHLLVTFRAVTVVVGGGLAYAAALPPYDRHALAWVALVPLLAVAAHTSARGAFLAGALYGSVFFAAIVPWVVGAVRAYFDASLLVGVGFGAAVCALYVAVYVGGFAMAARALLARGRWEALVAIPGLWVATELARTRLLTGLPWGFLGHSQWSIAPVIQAADLGGVFLVSWVVAAVNVGVWLAGDALRRPASHRLAAVGPLLAALAMVAALVGYGHWRLARETAAIEADTTRTLTLVQGNPSLASTVWQQAESERTLVLYGQLTRRAFAEKPDLVVWPEYALQLYPEQDARVLPVLTTLAAAAPAGLLFGAPRAVGVGAEMRFRNAAYHLAPDGRLAAYEKRRLVPFAEYQPLGLTGSGADREDRHFTAGGPAEPFATGVGRLGMLICYEIIHPAMVGDLIRAGAEVLVNVANDGWLDVARLGAAEQHLGIAVFRAVETRRYLARATASGISGFVDPRGRPYGLLATGVRGVTSGAVAPRRELTLYMRFGDVFAFTALALGLVVLARRGKEPAA